MGAANQSQRKRYQHGSRPVRDDEQAQPRELRDICDRRLFNTTQVKCVQMIYSRYSRCQHCPNKQAPQLQGNRIEDTSGSETVQNEKIFVLLAPPGYKRRFLLCSQCEFSTQPCRFALCQWSWLVMCLMPLHTCRCCSWRHSLTHLFIHSIIHLAINSFTQSLTHSLINSQAHLTD